jgi:hypothetical protein
MLQLVRRARLVRLPTAGEAAGSQASAAACSCACRTIHTAARNAGIINATHTPCAACSQRSAARAFSVAAAAYSRPRLYGARPFSSLCRTPSISSATLQRTSLRYGITALLARQQPFALNIHRAWMSAKAETAAAADPADPASEKSSEENQNPSDTKEGASEGDEREGEKKEGEEGEKDPNAEQIFETVEPISAARRLFRTLVLAAVVAGVGFAAYDYSGWFGPSIVAKRSLLSGLKAGQPLKDLIPPPGSGSYHMYSPVLLGTDMDIKHFFYEHPDRLEDLVNMLNISNMADPMGVATDRLDLDELHKAAYWMSFLHTMVTHNPHGPEDGQSDRFIVHLLHELQKKLLDRQNEFVKEWQELKDSGKIKPGKVLSPPSPILFQSTAANKPPPSAGLRPTSPADSDAHAKKMDFDGPIDEPKQRAPVVPTALTPSELRAQELERKAKEFAELRAKEYERLLPFQRAMKLNGSLDLDNVPLTLVQILMRHGMHKLTLDIGEKYEAIYREHLSKSVKESKMTLEQVEDEVRRKRPLFRSLAGDSSLSGPALPPMTVDVLLPLQSWVLLKHIMEIPLDTPGTDPIVPTVQHVYGGDIAEYKPDPLIKMAHGRNELSKEDRDTRHMREHFLTSYTWALMFYLCPPLPGTIPLWPPEATQACQDLLSVLLFDIPSFAEAIKKYPPSYHNAALQVFHVSAFMHSLAAVHISR